MTPGFMWITIWCMITVWPVNLSVSRAREGSGMHDSRVWESGSFYLLLTASYIIIYVYFNLT